MEKDIISLKEMARALKIDEKKLRMEFIALATQTVVNQWTCENSQTVIG